MTPPLRHISQTSLPTVTTGNSEMTNPFSSNELLKSLSNYPVAKGDVPGHEFHGNQYASIGDAVKNLSDKLDGRTPNGRRGTPAQMAKAHKAIAEMHTEASRTAPNNSSRIAHEQAAIAHYRAARIQRDPSEHEAVASGRVQPTLGRQLATADAIDASRATPEGRTTTMTQADIDHFNEAYDKGLI